MSKMREREDRREAERRASVAESERRSEETHQVMFRAEALSMATRRAESIEKNSGRDLNTATVVGMAKIFERYLRGNDG